MEVIEIISNFINKDNNVVEIEFRLRSDEEDRIRIDTIEFHHLNDFGYGAHFIPSDIFGDDEDFDFGFEDDDEEFFIDEDEMISFLNEYYLIFEDRLPDAEYR